MTEANLVEGIGITAEIIRSHLDSAAEEMRRALIKTAFNPVVYDVHDFGISIYNNALDLISAAPGIPSFLGANDYAIQKAVSYVGAENLEAGDILMMNYPYWNSAHTYDATLFAPIFDPKTTELWAYEVIRCHWLDLGAKNVGSVMDSTEMHQEGIVLPGTKVYKKGQPNTDVLEILKFNSRMPEAIFGDLNAQVSAIRTGERRLHQILQKFGKPMMRSAIDYILAAGEKASLEALEKLPHGSWKATDYLDDDGFTDDLIPMNVAVTVSSNEFKVDFTGSANAVKGPVNLPFGATQSICKIAFKGLTTPNASPNAGHYRPLKVEAPEGSLFHAVYPAPTFLLRAGTVALELIYKALAEGFKGLISASSGGDNPGFSMIGRRRDNGKLYWISNNEPVGWGAFATHDGGNGVQHHTVAVGRNTPIEVMELRTGMFIEQMQLTADSGGAGKYRGGLGVQRGIRFVEEGMFTCMIKKSKTRPWGIDGGGSPEANRMYIYAGKDDGKKVGTYRFQAQVGDRCILFTSGGGGYGNPRERDPELVLSDVLDGYVSPGAARSIYAVAVVDGKIEYQETKKLRA
ncbi:MAG: hydantoinase B/oxoprolinase family protein [Thaumarchaeota archaeon]|nr:hydantoinase B/oxoprolinase family protein [Nitrososphaerota archaeon]